MKAAIMQPYFLPYIGYFQLINAVDRFVIYDNIQYTKKGWINRNRILQQGRDVYITLPLRHGSDFLDIRERQLAENFKVFTQKQAGVLKEAYRKAPFFEQGFGLYQQVMQFEADNLFPFLHHAIQRVCAFLDIQTEIIVSSTLPVANGLNGAQRVLETCKAIQADTYINPIGGTMLYEKNDFLLHGIDLKFLKSYEIEYKQFDKPFVPWLSILDLVMFNEKKTLLSFLNHYELLNGATN